MSDVCTWCGCKVDGIHHLIWECPKMAEARKIVCPILAEYGAAILPKPLAIGSTPELTLNFDRTYWGDGVDEHPEHIRKIVGAGEDMKLTAGAKEHYEHIIEMYDDERCTVAKLMRNLRTQPTGPRKAEVPVPDLEVWRAPDKPKAYPDGSVAYPQLRVCPRRVCHMEAEDWRRADSGGQAWRRVCLQDRGRQR